MIVSCGGLEMLIDGLCALTASPALTLSRESTVSTTPEILFERARGGDRAAVGELLEYCRPYLRLIAERMLDDRLTPRFDASDIIQQTCLSVLKRFESFEGNDHAQFLAWLRRLHEHNLLNAARDHRDAEKRDIRREIPVDRFRSGLDGLAASVSSPSQRLLADERAMILAMALEQLPDRQREAIRCKYLEGLTVDEVAAHLKTTRYAVVGLLNRGLATLRHTLQQENSVT